MNFLSKKIIDFSPEFFGLDLSDLSLKAMHIKGAQSRRSVVSFGSAPLPRGSVVDGAIIKPDQVSAAILELLHKSHPRPIAPRHVVCSLPEVKAFLRIVNIPRMAPSEAREAVKWEMEANIPMSIDQVYYDWQILSRNFSRDPKKMSLLVVAVAKTTVDLYISVLQKSGLETVGLEIESIAQARSLLATTPPQQPGQKITERTTLIVDIGDRRTSFLIAVDGIPCFTSSIPLSSQSMTEALAAALNLSAVEAEKTKVNYGIGSALKNDHIFTALRPVLENLVAEINKSIEFYLTGLKYSQGIDQVILCGGGARTKGIAPYLSRRIGRNITLGDPWINIHTKKELPPIDRDVSVQYSAAIGLAIKELDYAHNT